MYVILSNFEEQGEAIISHKLRGAATYGNAPFPRVSDGGLIDRAFETQKEAKEYASRVFPNLKIIDETGSSSTAIKSDT